MANIAVTTYCNLKCPYCFADDMICEDKKQNITISQLQEILQWISRTPKNHIGIIGGEPTLHPHFDEVLKEVNKFCTSLNTGATLFTNGIYLDKWLPDIGNAIGVLINLNNPNNMTTTQYRNLSETLEHLNLLSWFVPSKPKATIGCNIYLGEDKYEWIWEVVDRYKLKRVRTSVTAPGGQYIDWRCNKEEYYETLKPIFLDFCKEAEKRRVVLGADCNQIPDCYFTEDEKKFVYTVMEGRHNGICTPVVDITPDFRATACFGSYDPVDCKDFENLIDLERYLLHRKSFPRVEKNCTGKCATCKQHELLTCQGGCLGFAGGA